MSKSSFFGPPTKKPQKIGVGLGMTKIFKNKKKSKNRVPRGSSGHG
jgi:hypothetical protein